MNDVVKMFGHIDWYFQFKNQLHIYKVIANLNNRLFSPLDLQLSIRSLSDYWENTIATRLIHRDGNTIVRFCLLFISFKFSMLLMLNRAGLNNVYDYYFTFLFYTIFIQPWFIVIGYLVAIMNPNSIGSGEEEHMKVIRGRCYN